MDATCDECGDDNDESIMVECDGCAQFLCPFCATEHWSRGCGGECGECGGTIGGEHHDGCVVGMEVAGGT